MKLIKIIMTLALAFASTFAFAGYVQPANVSIVTDVDGSGAASGDMLSARTSKATIIDGEGNEYQPELIGCGVKTFSPLVTGADGVLWSGFCQAIDAAGVEVRCFTEDAGLLDAMKAVADRSWLRFTWDTNFECTAIFVSTQSFYLEDKLKGNQ